MSDIEENLTPISAVDATVIRGGSVGESILFKGVYTAICYGPDGKEKWRDTIENVVCTLGKNLMLDSFLAGSSYTVTGPYMGLISSTSFTAVSAADTMTSHAGWLEAGNANAPTYSAPRKTCSWSAASGGAKSLATPNTFAMTGSGTVKGGFITLGSGALSTIDNTGGTLFSAGLFSGGDKTVGTGDSLAVSYTLSS